MNLPAQIKTEKELEPVLEQSPVNPTEAVYYAIRGHPNVTVLLPGTIGREFNKTFGHYHKHDEMEQYQVLLGTGLFLMQKREILNPETDVRAVYFQAGDQVEIPAGFGHTMINTGLEPVVTQDTAPEEAAEKINDYEPVAAKHGFYYYVVSEAGETKLVKNSRYD